MIQPLQSACAVCCAYAGMVSAVWAHGGAAHRLRTPVQVPYAIGGSGSAYITGFIDKHWRANMSPADGRDFCLRAVSHAFHRDGSSGGCVRMVTVTQDGYKEEFLPHTETTVGYGELPFPPAQSALAS
jgi:20S proteasome subunit beta 1